MYFSLVLMFLPAERKATRRKEVVSTSHGEVSSTADASVDDSESLLLLGFHDDEAKTLDDESESGPTSRSLRVWAVFFLLLFAVTLSLCRHSRLIFAPIAITRTIQAVLVLLVR